MCSQNALFSSLVVWDTSSTDLNLDNVWDDCEIPAKKKSSVKNKRSQPKIQKDRIKKGRIKKSKIKKLTYKPLHTSTPVKNELYTVEKVRDTYNDRLELSPIKESPYDIFELDGTTTLDHPSMDPFYCSKFVEPGTELRYEYENDYQYIYKVVDSDNLQFLAKRYFPYAGCKTSTEKKELKAKLGEEENGAISCSRKTSENIKSALKKEDAPRKFSNVGFKSFICRQKSL